MFSYKQDGIKERSVMDFNKMTEKYTENTQRTLYVGADESNHGGDSRGEIVLTTFSTKKEDGLVLPQQNRRDLSATELWLRQGGDYRFTIITYNPNDPLQSYNPNKGYNLVLVAPLLARHYLIQKSASEKFDNLKMFLDGNMQGYQRRFVKSDFPDFPNSVIDNFNKKQRNKQGKLCPGIVCPRVVKEADTLANLLFTKPLTELMANPNFVHIDSNLLIEKEQQLTHR
jgi:hypothetical protein